MPALNLSREPRKFSAMSETITEYGAKAKQATDAPWNVIVHNDPVNLMSYVTLIFQRVFGYAKARAERHMMEVHEAGRSVVWTGEREKAEFYVQQLHAHLLLATMEKAQ